MAGLLRPWLAATVEHELAAAIDWAHTRQPAGKISGDGKYNCTPHELTLRVNKGKPVQVIEIRNQASGGVGALLSDGTTHIRAEFDFACTKTYAQHHRKSFQDGTRGGFLGLTDFYLTVRFSPPGLSFRVADFKFFGSEQSPTAGRPVDVGTMAGIASQTTQLAGMLHRTLGGTPIKPQRDTETRSNMFLPIVSSQPQFATQLPPTPNISHRPVRPAQTVNKTNKTEISAALLGRFTGEAKAPAVFSKNVKEGGSREASMTTVGSRGGTPRNAVGNSVLKASPSPATKIKPNQGLPGITNRPQGCPTNVSDDLCTAEKVSTPGSAVISRDCEKENSQESQASKISGSTGPEIRSKSTGKENSTSQTKDTSPSIINLASNGPSFNGLKRVPRKYVQIPKNQQSLLMREDSWITNSNQTFSNAPAEVLKTSSSFVDKAMTCRNGMDVVEVAAANFPGDRENNQSRDSDSGSGSGSEYESANETKSFDGSLRTSATKNEHQAITSQPKVITSPLIDFKAVQQDIEMSAEEERNETLEDDVDTETEENDEISWPPSPERIMPRKDHYLQRESRSPTPAQYCNTIDDGHENASPQSATGSQPPLEVRKTSANNLHFGSPLLPNSSRVYKHTDSPVLMSSLSAPTDDEEMELGIPRAIGDSIDESDDEERNKTPHAIEVPSTLPSHNNIQVERTPRPFSSLARLRRAKSENTNAEKDTNGMDLLSSQIIPATCIDQSSLENKTSSVSVAPIAKPLIQDSPGAITSPPKANHIQVDLKSPSLTDSAAHISITPSNQSINISKAVYTTPPTEPTVQITNPGVISSSHQEAKFPSEPIPKNESFQTLMHTTNLEAAEADTESKVRLKVTTENSRRKKIFVDSRRSEQSTLKTDLRTVGNVEQHSSSLATRPTKSHNKTQTIKLRPETLPLATPIPENAYNDEPSRKEPGINATTEQIQDTNREIPVKSNEPQEKSSLSKSVFEQFCAEYPAFEGTQNLFIRVCVYITWLLSQHKQPHPCLWDDFVRCLSSDFPAYAKHTKDIGGKAITAIEYYNNEVEMPVYNTRILRPENLQRVLSINPILAKKTWDTFVDQVGNARGNPNHVPLPQAESAPPSASKTPNEKKPPLSSTESEASEADLYSKSESPTPVKTSKKSEPDFPLPVETVILPDELPMMANSRSRKRPFFQTHSQVATSVQVPADELVTDINDEESRRKRRSLPWGTPQGQLPAGELVTDFHDGEPPKKRRSLPLGRSEISPVIKPAIRNVQSHASSPSSTIARASTNGKRNSPHTKQPELVSGNGKQSHSESEPRADRLPQGSHDNTARKRRADGNSRPNISAASEMAKSKPAKSLDFKSGPVEGWALDQASKKNSKPGKAMGPPPTKAPRKFRSTQDLLSSDIGSTFVPRRKRLSGISSSMSTTSSAPFATPVSRKSSTPKVAVEPETQKWDFD